VTADAAALMFAGAIAAQRVGELVLSRRNAARVLARGAVESGARHFPLLVLVHTLFIVGIVIEVIVFDARPGRWWPAWLVLWVAAQALRYWAVHALGDRWNVRILVVPGEPPVSRGPYRFLRHPNYVAVVVELVAAPMVLGAWHTAVAASLVNLVVLRTRIRAEERALHATTTARAH
jgi:methyltransferase